MSAQTEMHFDAECEMLFGVGAAHVEPKRIFKYRFVAMRQQNGVE
jgi:hypothetical protein